MPDVVLPRLSDSMEEGVIVAWLKADGDWVTRGEPLAEIESDKAITIYEAPHEGTLKILKSEGETLAVGTVIAAIAVEGKDAAGQNGTRSPSPVASADAAGVSGTYEPKAQPREGEHGVAASSAHVSGAHVKASPVARRIARERGIELETVSGTGPQNRITRADVETALENVGSASDLAGSPASASSPVAVRGETEVIQHTQLQQVVARRMAEAKSTIPEFILQRDVDMEEAAALREGLRAAGGPEQPIPSFNDMVIKACALALRGRPDANAGFRDGRPERYSRVNVGLAVATPGALVVPVIIDADRLSLAAIAARSRELSARVRERKVTPAELEGATFTVSNLGMYGIGWFIPVINPPQAAILGVGAIEQRPVARESSVALRKRMTVTLVCDHRLIYGAEAAELLALICKNLELPLRLLQ